MAEVKWTLTPACEARGIEANLPAETRLIALRQNFKDIEASVDGGDPVPLVDVLDNVCRFAENHATIGPTSGAAAVLRAMIGEGGT